MWTYLVECLETIEILSQYDDMLIIRYLTLYNVRNVVNKNFISQRVLCGR